MSYLEEVSSATIDGRVWYKITEDNAFEDILEGYGQYEKVYNDHLKDFNVAVQAGGYCGVFPRLLGEIFSSVYTFEPDSLNFFCLVLNCQDDNIIKANAALGDEYGLVDVVRQHKNNRGMNYVKRTANAKIPTYRIDDLDLQACDLIQLDTEGYEHKILIGAKNTIERFKPLISVEDTNAQIGEFLESFGYKKVAEVFRDTVYKCEQ